MISNINKLIYKSVCESSVILHVHIRRRFKNLIRPFFEIVSFLPNIHLGWITIFVIHIKVLRLKFHHFIKLIVCFFFFSKTLMVCVLENFIIDNYDIFWHLEHRFYQFFFCVTINIYFEWTGYRLNFQKFKANLNLMSLNESDQSAPKNQTIR